MLCNYYTVGEHSFQLTFSKRNAWIDSLSNYIPFRVMDHVGTCLFQLTIVDSLDKNKEFRHVGRFDDDIASIDISKSPCGNFRILLAPPSSSSYGEMYINTEFREAQVSLPSDEQEAVFCLNNCLMLLYAIASAGLDTLLIHASVIKKENKGFVFLGKSGTGKSTHSRLWIDYIDSSELLNDDNPVIRIIDGRAYVFGSPWSGKTACYKNISVPLAGVVKLSQAPENLIKRLSALRAYATLLPACSNMSWEDDIATGIHLTLETLARSVACYQLDCLPDRDAAMLCASNLQNE
ncbi:MAG: hypothetical protein ACK5MG_04130 [Bacteroidales bacterium]